MSVLEDVSMRNWHIAFCDTVLSDMVFSSTHWQDPTLQWPNLTVSSGTIELIKTFL